MTKRRVSESLDQATTQVSENASKAKNAIFSLFSSGDKKEDE
jgi:hypothetical protein